MRPYVLFSYGVVLLALCIAGMLPILPSVGSFLLVAWLSKHLIVRDYWLIDAYIAQNGYAEELLQEYDIINEGTSLPENSSFISKLTHISVLDIGMLTLRHLNTLNAIYNK